MYSGPGTALRLVNGCCAIQASKAGTKAGLKRRR